MPKQARPLTDIQIRAAKSKDKQYKLSDGDGMYLLVKPNGSKHWRMDYYLHDKRGTAALGSYPEVPLAEARDKRLQARKLIAEGIAPVQHKQAAKQAVLAVTANIFEAVAWEWFEHHISTKSESHASRCRSYLENDLIPYLGKLPISSIEAPALLECLRRIESRTNSQGKTITETSNRVRALMSQLWRYAIATGKAQRDIAADLRGALKPHEGKNYSHIIDSAELGELLRVMKCYRGSIVVRAAVRLTPLFFVRPGELRHAKWREIDFDAKQWRYVSSKTKTDHIVPLSEQAAAILKDLQPLTGNGEYVLRGVDKTRPISDGTVNRALKSLGYDSSIIQPHGFRHTAATMLAELGWPPNEIERQLSHKESGIKNVYQKAQYVNFHANLTQGGCGRFLGLVYVVNPRLSRYSIGLK
jgi:integrase